jgi:hypothetical protein
VKYFYKLVQFMLVIIRPYCDNSIVHKKKGMTQQIYYINYTHFGIFYLGHYRKENMSLS